MNINTLNRSERQPVLDLHLTLIELKITSSSPTFINDRAENKQF